MTVSTQYDSKGNVVGTRTYYDTVYHPDEWHVLFVWEDAIHELEYHLPTGSDYAGFHVGDWAPFEVREGGWSHSWYIQPR